MYKHFVYKIRHVPSGLYYGRTQAYLVPSKFTKDFTSILSDLHDSGTTYLNPPKGVITNIIKYGAIRCHVKFAGYNPHDMPFKNSLVKAGDFVIDKFCLLKVGSNV